MTFPVKSVCRISLSDTQMTTVLKCTELLKKTPKIVFLKNLSKSCEVYEHDQGIRALNQ